MVVPERKMDVVVSLTLSETSIEKVDRMAEEWGLRGRSEVIGRLLQELLEGDQSA